MKLKRRSRSSGTVPKPGIAENAGVHFAKTKLVPASEILPDWNSLNDQFFSENGIVTAIVDGTKK